jgi:hypothetical protein
MALATMLSAQAYISLLDRIDHAHHHTHFANPLAGSVEFVPVAQDDDAGHRHAHGAVAHHDPGANTHHHSHGPVDHQHGGDAALVFLAAQSFILAAAPIPAYRYATGAAKLVSVDPRGLDHPPKPLLVTRV